MQIDDIRLATDELTAIHQRLVVPFAAATEPTDREVAVLPGDSGPEWAAWTDQGLATLRLGTGELSRSWTISSLAIEFLATAAVRLGLDDVGFRFAPDGMTADLDTLIHRVPVSEHEVPAIDEPDELHPIDVLVDREAMEAAVFGVVTFASPTVDARFVALHIDECGIGIEGTGVPGPLPLAYIETTGTSASATVVCAAPTLGAVVRSSVADHLRLRTTPGGVLCVTDDCGLRAIITSRDPALDAVHDAVRAAGNECEIRVHDGRQAVLLEWDDGRPLAITVDGATDAGGADAVARWGHDLVSDVAYSAELARELNECNLTTCGCVLVWRDGVIRVETAARVHDLEPQEFESRCAELARIADTIGPMLQIVHGDDACASRRDDGGH